MKRLPLALEIPLHAPASLYSGLMHLRNLAFDRGWLSSHSSILPVVSIGNLTAGGTGKTPVVAFLVSNLLSRGVKPGIVSRGYGRTGEGCERVIPDGSLVSAERFGDEPSLLAAKFQTVPVYVSADRLAAMAALARDAEVSVALADDAFQHRRLKRDLDIVIVDASEPDWHERPLPLGRMREGFESLARAQMVFLTKTNLADPLRLSYLRKQIESHRSLGVRVHEFTSVISGYTRLGKHEEAHLAKDAKVLLVSGIGRPESFSSLVKESRDLKIEDHMIFKDHHRYTGGDLKTIEIRAEALGVEAILVTEKDAVKLSGWQPNKPCLVSRLDVHPTSDLGDVYEAISRLRR